MNEIEKYNDGELEPQQNNEFNEKIAILANNLLRTSQDDRGRALRLYNYIDTLVKQIENDNLSFDEIKIKLFEEAEKTGLSKEQLRELAQLIGRKKNPASLLEQMNRTLELSIKSSDNLVKLTDILTKLKTASGKVITNINFESDVASNRTKYLKEMKSNTETKED